MRPWRTTTGTTHDFNEGLMGGADGSTSSSVFRVIRGSGNCRIILVLHFVLDAHWFNRYKAPTSVRWDLGKLIASPKRKPGIQQGARQADQGMGIPRVSPVAAMSRKWNPVISSYVYLFSSSPSFLEKCRGFSLSPGG
jgi:hypothetical protein